MSSLIGWVVLLSVLGAVAGGLYWQTLRGAAIGILAGAFVATVTWIRNIASILFPDSFIAYASDANNITQPEKQAVTTERYLDLQIWTDKTNSSWIRLGVTDEQWRTMAIAAHNAQAFSTDVIDRAIYGKLKKRFEETGIITPKGSGYDLTRAGKNLVKMLATLPYPYEDVPELVKLLDETPRTQTRTDPYAKQTE